LKFPNLGKEKRQFKKLFTKNLCIYIYINIEQKQKKTEMTEPVFEEAVYKGYNARAKLVKDTIKAFGHFNMDAVLTVVAECTFDSGYEQKTQVVKTHAEEKMHLFMIKQKQEQQRPLHPL